MTLFSANFIFLYTDILLFLLIGIGLAYFWYARQHEHLIAPWKYLARSKVAMGSAAVLITYLLVAVADSIHFQLPVKDPVTATAEKSEIQYQSEVLSLLDISLETLRTRQEKSYSAPFASRLYTKENIERADGTTTRDYPALRYGGVHLQEGESKKSDIFWRSIKGLFQGLLLGLLLTLLLAYRYCCKYSDSTQSTKARFLSSFYTVLPFGSILLDSSNNTAPTTQKKPAQWSTFIGMATFIFILIAIMMELSQVYHVLGTDKIGESVLFQGIKSIRTGILIGTLTTLVMLPFAIFLGIAAGYFRGWIDDVIQYIYTTLNSIPGVLLIASAILMLQVYLDNNPDQYSSLLERADLRLLFLCMILGVTSWTGLCRYLRAESLKLREMDYIAAARTMGVGHGTILSRHILPNVMHIVLITVVLDFSGLVLAEAVLAYVQIGVDPTTESWGNMINSARLEMARDPIVWWSLAAAFFFMLVLVLAANLFSDVVRDALDPRGRNHD